jgi:hypothetical protein
MRQVDKQTLKANQQGMAAMVIVTVLMFVISIIVLGFAQVVRREQRNALDNQLATQAYYAAESGLNLARDKVQRVVAAGDTITQKKACNDNSTDPDYTDVTNKFNIGENAQITCMLIDPDLDYLDYQKVGLDSVPVLVKAKAGSIANIFVSWELSTSEAQSIDNCNGSTTVLEPNAASRACKQPLLRVDLVPVTGSMTADYLKNNQYTTFLSPSNVGVGPGSITYSPGSVSNIFPVSCATRNTKQCTAQIAVPGGNAYALRIMSIYGESNVTIFAEDASNRRLTLIEGQVLIDVTAKTADVLKRLQARMPVRGGANIPDFAISAGGGVCKRYQISGGEPSIDGEGLVSTRYPGCNIPI